MLCATRDIADFLNLYLKWPLNDRYALFTID